MTPKDPQKTPRYAIIRLSDGKELDSRETYWKALLHAYSILRMGTFTLEEKNDSQPN